MPQLSDKVRIKDCPETRDAGVAGAQGTVFGFTAPSRSGVEVVGGAPDDHAINVSLDATGQDLWFRPDLLEDVRIQVGASFTIGGMRLERRADGGWATVPVTPPASRDPD